LKLKKRIILPELLPKVHLTKRGRYAPDRIVVGFWIRFCDRQTGAGPEKRAAFQFGLKRRLYMLISPP
jgi:hypothetical protein